MRAYLNASDVARLLNVDRATVSRWAKNGNLKGAIRVEGTLQWRIPLSTYETLAKDTVTQKSHEKRT